MNFLGYPKIDVRPAREVGGAWVATEKVHGANFTVVTDGAAVRFGKRKAWLLRDERFFGWQLLRGELTAAAFNAWRLLGGRGVLRLYGELFGGHYPHPHVAPVPGCEAVQTGIWYAPQVRFALFDALVEPDLVFLSFTEVCALASGCGLLTVPVLGRGSRAELRNVPVRSATRVPGLLGLPPIEGNLAEGFVLKPEARLHAAQRPVLKCKLPEFDEARFDEARRWADRPKLSVEALITVASGLVNPARIASARSKVGDGAPVIDEAVYDVLVDLQAAFPSAMLALSPEGEARLEGELRAQVSASCPLGRCSG
jgi:Rnl2 family RNA ligase